MTHKELVERIAAGEESLIADLWSQVEKFVAWRANRFFYSYMERCQSLVIDTDDLIQVGYFALLQSVEKYDPVRGTKFLTAFEYYLKTQFFTLAKMRHTGWYKNPIHRCEHLDEAISNTEGLTLADTIASETDEIAETEHEAYLAAIQPVLDNVLQELTTRQLDIVTSIYCDGLTFEATAQKYQISKGGVSRIRSRAIHNLQSNAQLQAVYAC
ncbi:MAG: sigma-70 family RNA polymerase sigma factor [Clostridiales bacterium]|nr:sigma-70 family RNA polymerase sigma factor [Clostridiales bacterium]